MTTINGQHSIRLNIQATAGGVMDWGSDRVATALARTDPTVLADLDAAFAIIDDVQWLPTYGTSYLTQ